MSWALLIALLLMVIAFIFASKLDIKIANKFLGGNKE